MNNQLAAVLSGEPAYRLKQIEEAKFNPLINSFAEITSLPKELREKLSLLPWLSVKLITMQESQIDNTKKAALELSDGAIIETVLMGREMKRKIKKAEERYTVCLSSQAGCALGCLFCATGASGLQRNLSSEEIVDQYRFWQRQLSLTKGKIDNVVFMGQGEPLLNYEAVKQAIIILLRNTDTGPTKITLSTVGVRAGMEKILTDPDFPPVRLAISLHSAIETTRRHLIPSHEKNFFDFLLNWAGHYHDKFPSRAHFLGLEYILFAGVNDDEKHLKAFLKLAAKMGRVRINLIPFNMVGTSLRGSDDKVVKNWHDILMKNGFIATIRRSQGADIAAACGQLGLELLKK